MKQQIIYTVFTIFAMIDVLLFGLAATSKFKPSILAEAAPGNWNMLLSLGTYDMKES